MGSTNLYSKEKRNISKIKDFSPEKSGYKWRKMFYGGSLC